MRYVTAFDRAVQKAEVALAILTMTGVVGLLSAQVFFRYVLQDPIFFAEEVALVFLIIATFAGLSLIVAERRMIGVDLVGPQLSPENRARLGMFVQLLLVAICGALAFFALNYVLTPWVWFERFATIPLPRAYLYCIVAAELCFMTMHQLVHVLDASPTREAEL